MLKGYDFSGEKKVEYYIVYRYLGDATVQVDGFKTELEMQEYIKLLEKHKAIIYDLLESM